MSAVSSSASDMSATRAAPAATMPVIARATQPIGPSAVFRAAPKAVTAGIATVVTNVTPAIPATTTPSPMPIAVIAFVRVGCSCRNSPIPCTNPASAFEAFSSVGVTAVPKAALMELPACCQLSPIDFASVLTFPSASYISSVPP